MAHIYVQNSLNSRMAVRMNLNIPMFVTTESEGEPIWVLEVATTYPSASGTDIRPVYINKTDADDDLDVAIADAISKISSQIDWGELVVDDKVPYVAEARPYGPDVAISSEIYIDIKEEAPSAGIDMSEVEVILNNGVMDFDITDQCIVDGDPFNFLIKWKPPNVVMGYYDKD